MKNFFIIAALKKALILLIFLSMGLSLPAADFETLEAVKIHSELHFENLTPQMYIYHNPEANVSVEEVVAGLKKEKLKKYHKTIFNIGVKKRSHWLLLKTANESDKNFDWAMHFAFPRIEKIVIYKVEDGKAQKIKQLGDELVFSSRDFMHPHYVARMRAEALASQIFLFEVKANRLFGFEILYQNINDFFTDTIEDNFLDGLFFGFIFLLSIVAILFYKAVREKVYLLYALWLLIISFFLLILKGYAFAYLWPNYPKFSNFIILPITTWANLIGVVFLREFTDKKKINGLFISHLILGIILFVLSSLPFILFEIRLLMIGSLTFFSMITMFIVGVQNYMSRERSARFLLIGNAFLLLGILLFSLRLFSIIEDTSFAFRIFQWGILLNAVFLLLALQHKIQGINLELHDYRDNLEYFSTIFESMNESVMVLNNDLTIRFANRETCLMLGYSQDELLQKNFKEILNTDSFLFSNTDEVLTQLEHINQAELEYIHKNGSLVAVLFSGSAILAGDQSIEGIACIALNLHNLKIAHERAIFAEANVVAQKKYFEQVLNQASSEIFVVNRNFEYEFINPAIVQAYSVRQDIIGKTDFEVCPLLNLDSAIANLRFEKLKKVIESKKSVTYEEKIQNENGQVHYYLKTLNPIFNEKNEVDKIIGSSINITERKKAEIKLEKQANTDDLTNIPNRYYFLNQINETFEAYNNDIIKTFAIFFLDVDRFKIINDSLGHLIGDKLLITIAKRLQEKLTQDVVIARYGGDEFTILLKNYSSIEDVLETAQTIQQALSETYFIDNHEIITSSSVGVALAREYYENPSQIIRDADLALYHAKSKGRARFQIFNEEMHKQTVAIQKLESNLRKAFDRGEFSLRFQPVFDLKSSSIKGFEALLRWRNKELGDVSPMDFIPLAEETGLIYRIGRWVMREAFRNARRWNKIGFDKISIAVNLSARQFQNVNFIGDLHELLKETQVISSNVEFELTESIIMGEDEVSLAILKELSDQNMKIAIDDFGTGYSSFAYLKRFKIDTIKIDKSFVKDVLSNDNSRALFLSMIAMAKSLGLKVTAEGVETKEQFDFIKTTECDYVQGNYISLPLTSKEATKLLRKGIGVG